MRPHLLPRVRLPEPGGRELLRPLRRAAREDERRRDDADVQSRGGLRGGRRRAEDLGVEGPALVVRSGGGRAGETFFPQGDRTTIGRSPDCGIFLDDVTVSRRHAVLVERDGALLDRGPRQPQRHVRQPPRIESARLEDGDEVQIGKYRLTFLAR